MRGIDEAIKIALARAGRYVSPRVTSEINGGLNYLTTSRTLRDLGLEPQLLVDERFQVFDWVFPQLRSGRVQYLEFGVAAGATTRHWSENLQNPDLRMHGFDSFEGLPEDYSDNLPKGGFDMGGRTPDIDDPRIEWHPGWFDDVLASFSLPEHDRLFVNVDSDLYSSAVTVLSWARPHLRVGDFIYFDEFQDRAHEGRAFRELLIDAGFGFECLVATKTLTNVLFGITRVP